MQFSRRQAFIALCLLALIPIQAGAQCAMCGMVGQGPDDPLVKGMFRSILFMVSMPFALLFSVGGWLVYKLRDQAEDGVIFCLGKAKHACKHLLVYLWFSDNSLAFGY